MVERDRQVSSSPISISMSPQGPERRTTARSDPRHTDRARTCTSGGRGTPRQRAPEPGGARTRAARRRRAAARAGLLLFPTVTYSPPRTLRATARAGTLHRSTEVGQYRRSSQNSPRQSNNSQKSTADEEVEEEEEEGHFTGAQPSRERSSSNPRRSAHN
ncbi:hypothetical protein GN956_G20214 [Arapaima gigas]